MNSGNLVFFDALKNLLPLQVLPVRMRDEMKCNLNDFHSFITTELIWIRQNSEYPRLEKFLNSTNCPVVPISVGL